jgi:hypothetical protein
MTSSLVAKSPGCQPLNAMYRQAVLDRPARWTQSLGKNWLSACFRIAKSFFFNGAIRARTNKFTRSQVETPFLQAMWEFDQSCELGTVNQGDNQNGKGDFFTDLIALLLDNCSGKQLHGRGSVPGLIFPKHALDASPESGEVEVLIETKAAGAPKSPRNPRQKNPLGRDGSADLDKRVKEAGLKTIDLKAEWARQAGRGGGPTSDLLTWLRQSKPLSFLFLAIRVIDDKDFARTLAAANAAQRMMDDIGLVAYEHQPAGDGYRARKIPAHLELDRVLSRLCTALRNLP